MSSSVWRDTRRDGSALPDILLLGLETILTLSGSGSEDRVAGKPESAEEILIEVINSAELDDPLGLLGDELDDPPGLPGDELDDPSGLPAGCTDNKSGSVNDWTSIFH